MDKIPDQVVNTIKTRLENMTRVMAREVSGKPAEMMLDLLILRELATVQLDMMGKMDPAITDDVRKQGEMFVHDMIKVGVMVILKNGKTNEGRKDL